MSLFNNIMKCFFQWLFHFNCSISELLRNMIKIKKALSWRKKLFTYLPISFKQVTVTSVSPTFRKEVSAFPGLSKIFKKLMKKWFNSSKCRFVFQYLCELSLQTDPITLHDRWMACIEEKCFAGLFFTNQSKTFETVNRDSLPSN